MNDLLIEKTKTFFQNTFQNTPEKIVLSPGRITILGSILITMTVLFYLPRSIKLFASLFQKTIQRNPK